MNEFFANNEEKKKTGLTHSVKDTSAKCLQIVFELFHNLVT